MIDIDQWVTHVNDTSRKKKAMSASTDSTRTEQSAGQIFQRLSDEPDGLIRNDPAKDVNENGAGPCSFITPTAMTIKPPQEAIPTTRSSSSSPSFWTRLRAAQADFDTKRRARKSDKNTRVFNGYAYKLHDLLKEQNQDPRRIATPKVTLTKTQDKPHIMLFASLDQIRQDLAIGFRTAYTDVQFRQQKQPTGGNPGRIVNISVRIPSVHQIGLIIFDEYHQAQSLGSVTFQTLSRLRLFKESELFPFFIPISGSLFTFSPSSIHTAIYLMYHPSCLKNLKKVLNLL